MNKEENQYLEVVTTKRDQVLINMLKDPKIFRNIELSLQLFRINKSLLWQKLIKNTNNKMSLLNKILDKKLTLVK